MWYAPNAAIAIIYLRKIVPWIWGFSAFSTNRNNIGLWIEDGKSLVQYLGGVVRTQIRNLS